MKRYSDGTVLIVTGPPGAGKTTVAKLLAEQRVPGVHLEADRFFDFILSGYTAPWKQESHDQNTIVMRAVAGAAASYADGGYATIVDGIVSAPTDVGDVCRARIGARHRSPG